MATAVNENETMEVEQSEVPADITATWIDLISDESNDKLRSELSKIGKMTTLMKKKNDIAEARKYHRLSMYPIYPQDLTDPYILEVMKKCHRSSINFTTAKDKDGETIYSGLLHLTFDKASDVQVHAEQFASFRDDIHIDYKLNNKKDTEAFSKQWLVISEQQGPEPTEDANDLVLYAPSLPENITEDELWELFPRATEIWLIPGKPRKHAYLEFRSEDAISESISELKTNGAPRTDFNFCRLVRFSKILAIVREEKLSRTPNAAARGKSDEPQPDAETTPANKARNRRNAARKKKAKQASAGATTKANAEPTAAEKATVEPTAKNDQVKAKPKQTPKQTTEKPQQQNQKKKQKGQSVQPSAPTQYARQRATYTNKLKQQNTRSGGPNPGMHLLGGLLSAIGNIQKSTQPASQPGPSPLEVFSRFLSQQQQQQQGAANNPTQPPQQGSKKNKNKKKKAGGPGLNQGGGISGQGVQGNLWQQQPQGGQNIQQRQGDQGGQGGQQGEWYGTGESQSKRPLSLERTPGRGMKRQKQNSRRNSYGREADFSQDFTQGYNYSAAPSQSGQYDYNQGFTQNSSYPEESKPRSLNNVISALQIISRGANSYSGTSKPTSNLYSSGQSSGGYGNAGGYGNTGGSGNSGGYGNTGIGAYGNTGIGAYGNTGIGAYGSSGNRYNQQSSSGYPSYY